jgi:FkbH-like protein
MTATAAAPLSAPATIDGLSFLEAKRTLSAFAGGPTLPFLFAASGTMEPMRVYLEAACARRQRTADARVLPFGTLGQFLSTSSRPERPEVFLLFPWDLAPELDWRSGVPRTRVVRGDVLARADATVAALARRDASLFYVPCVTPPVSGHGADDTSLRQQLDSRVVAAGASLLPPDVFSLAGYFASGCPVAGAWLGRVAVQAVSALLDPLPAAAKLLVTDLDNTLWRGVLAEDGVDGVAFDQSGAGFRHYIYQSLLLRLRREGTLLAAVTRNDHSTVAPLLDSQEMPLSTGDFVAVCASYHAKSAQIRDLAARLNLGLDSVVFVDDNPIELEEVSIALPEVRVLAFPKTDDGLPPFLERVAGAFGRRELTAEDRDRTEMYRRRADGMLPSTASPADLRAFLTALDMELEFHDRSNGNRDRAVQLINKTNQFNANGRRWTDDEVDAALAGGGQLITASLRDRTGTHGEIAACLLDKSGVIEAFVLSCRVFQRRVEHAFLTTVASRSTRPIGVRYTSTDRNEPFRQFIADEAFGVDRSGVVAFDAAAWEERHRDDLGLFRVLWS